MALTLILSVGLNAELLSIRNAVLQSGGYFAWIRASESRIPGVVVSENSNEHGGLSGSTVGSRPKELLEGIREILIKATPAVWTSPSCRNGNSGITPSRDPYAAQELKPAQSASAYERKAEVTNDCSVVLARVS